MTSEILFSTQPEICWVLDSSALIEFKKLIPISKQWKAFRYLEDQVESGSITIPDEAIDELGDVTHPDLPGAWAYGIKRIRRDPKVPDNEYIDRVMTDAGDVVDHKKKKGDADPYVLALALHLQSAGCDVSVVTEDFVDRLPRKRSLWGACDLVGIRAERAKDFLISQGIVKGA